MGDDGSIPDHVNDGVPEDEIIRFTRYEIALGIMAGRDDYALGESTPLGADARRLYGREDNALDRMRRQAFINAAISNVPAVTKKLRAAYPTITDLQALLEALRLEVIIRRLD